MVQSQEHHPSFHFFLLFFVFFFLRRARPCARVRTREERGARVCSSEHRAGWRHPWGAGGGGCPEESRQDLPLPGCQRENVCLLIVSTKAPLCHAAWSQALPHAAPGWRRRGEVLAMASGALRGVIFRHSAAPAQQLQCLQPLSAQR